MLFSQIRNVDTQSCLDTLGRKSGENLGTSYCHGLGGNQVGIDQIHLRNNFFLLFFSFHLFYSSEMSPFTFFLSLTFHVSVLIFHLCMFIFQMYRDVFIIVCFSFSFIVLVLLLVVMFIVHKFILFTYMFVFMCILNTYIQSELIYEKYYKVCSFLFCVHV